jgi:RHS repeat-associated protein
MDTVTTVAAFGIKQGSFSVDANGAANYQLPLEIPPGIVNAQPNLQLSYNQSAGNGVCGIGWTLAGVSSITRINAVPAIDGFWGCINYDDNDRFALDGQRLINITGDYGQAGTIYYTENHQWDQVVAGTTPQDGYTVYKKNGAIWSYGSTSDSCILALGTSNVREWALASIQDLNGNRVEYQYTNIPLAGGSDTGAYYLSKILYTVTDSNEALFSINFGYATRPDIITTYLGGCLVETCCILTTIQTMIGAAIIRSYTLGYGQGAATGFSRVDAITITDANGNALPPIQIGWQDVAQPGFDTSQPSSVLLNQSGVLQTSPVDVNGDGITDILQFYENQQLLYVVSFLASQANGQITYSTQHPNGQQLGHYSGVFGTDYNLFTADVNGDGLTDIVVVYPGGNNNQLLCIDVFINTGSSFSKPYTTNTSNPWQGNSSLGFFAIDANGDGRVDLVQAYNYDNILNFNVWLSDFVGSTGSFSGTAFNYDTKGEYASPVFWPMDVNNDGITDMVVLWQNSDNLYQVTAFISTDTPGGLNLFTTPVTTNLKAPGNGTLSILPVDVNGDGVLDILQLIESENNSSFILQPFFSTGTGQFVAGAPSNFQSEQFSASDLYPMGLNGNGQTNIVGSWLDDKNYWNYTVFSANPSGVFTQGPTIKPGQTFPQLNFFAGDANGDGKADLFYTYTGAKNNIYVQPFPSAGPYPDLANSIIDQLGNTSTISYAPLTDASVYTETAPAYPATTARQYPCILSPVQFPVQGVIGMAKYVVSAYTFTNDATLNRFPYSQAFAMQYKNARIDLTGRGWQGFEIVQQTNTGTGLTVVKNYLQAFPYTGSLVSLSKSQNGNELLKLTVSTYQSVPFPGAGGSADNAAYEVLKAGILDYYYNYGVANFDSLTAKSFAYDDYGNQSEKIWWGYINYIDPSGIDPAAGFPPVTPVAPYEIVYRYRQYQNDVLTNGWALGYLLYDKQSANSIDADISSFLPGDLNLSTCTYTAQGYNLATRGAWDSQNNVMLTTSFTYDVYGNKTSETRPGNFTTQYAFETSYNCYRESMISAANAQGVQLTTQYGYDPRFGQLVAQQNANGFTTIVALDGFGRKVVEQGPIPPGCTQTDTNQCTPFVTGSVAFAAATVLTLKTMAYQDDGAGGIYLQGSVLQAFPDNTSPVWADHWKYIDGKGRTAQVAVEAGGNNGYSIQVTSYGAYERPLNKTLPFYSASLQVSLPVNGPATVFTYDALQRPLTKQTPGGANNNVLVTATWSYANWGQTTITDASGAPEAYVQVVSRHWFNGKPQQVQSVITNDNNASTSFVYDALGRMTSVTDPAGIQNTLVYDSLGRKINYDNPDQNPINYATGALAYQYDPVTGSVQTITDASSATVTYSYDALGRVINESYSDGCQNAYTYDTASNGAGQLATVIITSPVNGSSQKSMAYDVYGNANSETLTVNSETYTTGSVFDPLKRLVEQTYDDGSTLTRTYDCGLLVSQQLEAVSIDYPVDDYQANGRFGVVQYGYEGNNVLAANYTYNSAGTAYAESFEDSSNEQLLNFSYSYDQLNELLTSDESVEGTSQAYSYASKRIQTVSGSADMPTGSYAYDSAGRLTGKDNNNYAYEGSNCPLSITGDVQYSITRDASGRIATRTVNGVTDDFVYAASGNLVMIMQGGNIFRAMQYDEQGNRLLEVYMDGATMVYVNPGYHVFTNKAGATTIFKNLMDSAGMVASLSSSDAGSPALFYRRDQKKNVTHIFNNTGELLSAFAFDGFGNATQLMTAENPPPLYEGRELDAGTGLYYFGARYYDPMPGTFLTPDSRLGAKNKLTAGAWNRFAFELNNGVNQVDPSGHHSIWADIGLAVGAVALVAVTAVAIVLTIPTAGASDAVAGELDAGLGGLELADLGVDAGVDAGADAAADAGADTAADAGSDLAAGGSEGGGGLGKTVVRVGVRLGTNAVKGAVIGAVTNGAEYEVESGFKGSWSGLLKAVETGAISGAVSGVVSGELTAMVNLSDYSLFGRIAVTGIAGAAGSVSGKIVSTEIMDQQFPSVTSLAESAASGFASGALANKDNLVGLKNYFFPPAAAGPIEIEMTVFKSNI